MKELLEMIQPLRPLLPRESSKNQIHLFLLRQRSVARAQVLLKAEPERRRAPARPKACPPTVHAHGVTHTLY
jgi:hypothetical protein